jgi:hypothetical protein
MFSLNLVRLIKMCLNEAYSKYRIGKILSDAFSMQNNETRRFFSVIAVQVYFIICHQKAQENQERLEFNGTYQQLVYADDDSIFGDYINTIRRGTETLIGVSRKVDL